MLDIKFIRENKEIVAAGARKKHITIDLDALLALDDKRKELQQLVDEKRSEQHVASSQITKASASEREALTIPYRRLVLDFGREARARRGPRLVLVRAGDLCARGSGRAGRIRLARSLIRFFARGLRIRWPFGAFVAPRGSPAGEERPSLFSSASR